METKGIFDLARDHRFDALELADRHVELAADAGVGAGDGEGGGAVGHRRARQVPDVEQLLAHDPVGHRDREHHEPEQRHRRQQRDDYMQLEAAADPRLLLEAGA